MAPLIPAYGKIIPLDKGKYTQGLFDAPVVIQEKIDGSQVSFGLEDPTGGFPQGIEDYYPVVRSKNTIVEDGNKQFQMVKDWVQEHTRDLDPDFIYRGEAVTSLKHNTLKYERVPVGGVVLFDIYDCHRDCMLLPAEVLREADRLGLEYVQTFIDCAPSDASYCEACLKLGKPMLGGKQIEGVVIKRYDLPDPQSFANTHDAQGFLKVKLVSEDFKEIHHADWKDRNPNGKDFIANLVTVYGTEARLSKSVQHLRDEGALVGTPTDIGALIKEVQRDLEEECAEEIKEALWKRYGKEVLQGVAHKMPDYYKTTHLGLV